MEEISATASVDTDLIGGFVCELAHEANGRATSLQPQSDHCRHYLHLWIAFKPLIEVGEKLADWQLKKAISANHEWFQRVWGVILHGDQNRVLILHDPESNVSSQWLLECRRLQVGRFIK